MYLWLIWLRVDEKGRYKIDANPILEDKTKDINNVEIIDKSE